MEKPEQKRDRSTNFTSEDVDVLCNLVYKYKDTLECKKTDAQTWRTKEEKWSKLTTEFNLQTRGPPRTQKSLKTKYDTFKKELRKKVAKHKENLYKTGGGAPEEIVLTPTEEKIYSIIYLSIEGMPSRYDSDYLEGTSDPVMQEIETPSETIFLDYVDEEAENVTIEFQDEEMPHAEYVNIQSRGDLNEDNTPKSTKKLLKSSISQQLRPLHSTNLNSKEAKLTKLEAAKKVTILSSKKKELLEVQKSYYEEELEFKRKENEIKLDKARKELQKEEIDIEIKLIEKRIKEETLKKILHNQINL